MSSRFSRRKWLSLLASSTALYAVGSVWAQEPRDQLNEPVLRVSKRIAPEAGVKAHPLDPAIRIAEDGLARIQKEVIDYSCTMVKQERINGELNPPEHVRAEIRNRKIGETGMTQPLSVYLYFLKPDDFQGREVIYVEGQNNGKMVAHEAKGIKAQFGDVWLNPDGILAMHGQRYPITDIGIENLVAKLIERATRDKNADPDAATTEVRFTKGAKINGRGCMVIEVVHAEPRPHYDFHIAQVFIDDELQVPVRYAAYTWPLVPGGKPQLEEAYTYLDLKLNVGLKDDDFDHTKKFRK